MVSGLHFYISHNILTDQHHSYTTWWHPHILPWCHSSTCDCQGWIHPNSPSSGCVWRPTMRTAGKVALAGLQNTLLVSFYPHMQYKYNVTVWKCMIYFVMILNQKTADRTSSNTSLGNSSGFLPENIHTNSLIVLLYLIVNKYSTLYLLFGHGSYFHNEESLT